MRDLSDEKLRTARAVLGNFLFPFVRQTFRTIRPGDTFHDAPHVEAICYALMRVVSGEVRRQIITVPPRHLKSVCTSVALPAWLLARDPALKIMVASYAEDIGREHSRNFRRVIESQWYRGFWGERFTDKNTETHIVTAANGGRKAVSVKSSVTGFGADYIIVDDFMKAGDAGSPTVRQSVRDFFEQSLLSRLDNRAEGRIIVIQQRLHEDDYVGYLLERGGWEQLDLKAIAEVDERIPLTNGRFFQRSKGEPLFPALQNLNVLAETRREMGRAAFEAQYQGNPGQAEANGLRWEWFGTYDEVPARTELLMVVQSWDPGVSDEANADPSVCTTWGLSKTGTWLLLDVFRERLDYPSLKRKVIALRSRWRADTVLVETANAGFALWQEFRNEGRGMLEGYKPLLSKEMRFGAQLAKIEDGKVALPREAPWLPEFKRELQGFPQRKHDDQVDSVSQFLDWTGRRNVIPGIEQRLAGGKLRPQSVRRPQRVVR